jgi:hypothetical protein
MVVGYPIEDEQGLLQWITEQRKAFQKRVRGYLGPKAKTISLEPHGILTILKHLDTYHHDDHLLIGDLGAGLSTIILRQWAEEHHNARIASMDHDPEWLRFIGQTLNQIGLGIEPHLLLERSEHYLWAKAKAWCFDTIIVDHGPEMQTRRDDLRWIRDCLKDDGWLFLDDFHLNHEAQCRKVLDQIGEWSIATASDDKGSKPIGCVQLLSRKPKPPPATEPYARGPRRGRRGRR